MNNQLILKKGIVNRKLDRYRYEVERDNGGVIEISIPKKLFINYIEIKLNTEVYFTVPSEDSVIGLLATKHDFMKYPELLTQKNILDAQED